MYLRNTVFTLLITILQQISHLVDASCSNPTDVRDVTATASARRLFFPLSDAPSSTYDVCYDWRITAQVGEVLELYLVMATQYDQPCTVGRSCLYIYDGYNYSAIFGYRKLREEDGNVTDALRLAYPTHQSVFIRFYTYENSSFVLQHRSRNDIDDGGFATEQKRTVGIAIVSCAAALVVIIITIFTILACSRERGKETDSQSGLVNESSRVQDNENNLFRRTNRRFSMSML
ncbi:uncharacterized protein LOC125682445 [Ostrea edulis]|uniref:uncharacterized protein LOC125682445 n=1 Tax=Ostrea edulis TaxID=37623 RepID=UPI0020955C3A|nr:uncharacterized protein LOC125682445 [Ostrea edulis]XP_048779004.1 uncharacterized protein LOC125682445 [Ostrea edulis]XP_048779005.1 uncharacterized protein LOC125682445 [Ostrea edulis]